MTDPANTTTSRDAHISLLEQLQEDFGRLTASDTPVRARLTHTATNAEIQGVTGHPDPDTHGVVALGSAGDRGFEQRLDSDGSPRFSECPVLDVAGNPITDPAGNYLDVRMPVHRSVTFTGAYSSYSRLVTRAQRAGRLVMQLDPYPALQPLAGWQFNKSEDCWWALVFETALSGSHPLSPTRRWIWTLKNNTAHSFPYDLEELQRIAALGVWVPPQWLSVLPEAWTAVLDDMASASFDTIEVLIPSMRSSNESRDRDLPLFISHARVDAELLPPLLCLLQSALGLSANQIRCTSIEGQGFPAGSHAEERIREEAFEAKACIFLVSEASIDSQWVMSEIWPRWQAKKPFFPLLVPGADPALLEGPLSAITACRRDRTRFRLTLYTTPSRPPETNAVDESILEALSADEDLPTNQITEAIGRTPRTTRTRLIKLADRNFVREVGTSPQDPKRPYSRAR